MSSSVNWEWNLEALNVQIGLDSNSAHVKPNVKYHYNGKSSLFLENMNINTSKMTLIGFAADGFPVYYKDTHSNAFDSLSCPQFIC